MLAELLPLGQPPGAGRDDEAGLAARAQFGVDGGHDHVDVGDAAVGDPGLGAVEHPLVGGLVVDGAGADRAHVAARVGLGGAERAQAHVVGGAEHLRGPLQDLLLGAVGGDGHRGQRGAGQRQRDAGIAPVQLLVDDGDAHPAGLEHLVGEEVEGVQADPGGLLEDRPGGLLPFVPLRGGGADDVAGELVHPVADLAQVLAQFEAERRCGRLVGHGGSSSEGRGHISVTNGNIWPGSCHGGGPAPRRGHPRGTARAEPRQR